MTEKAQFSFTIPDNLGGLRLDQAITKILPNYSRTQIQEWIKKGNLLVNNEIAKAKSIVFGGEAVLLNAEMKPQPSWEAQAITLDIVHEDTTLLVINKPAGMVVHPGAGNQQNTLLNALLHHCPDVKMLPRAGIIHRLDKDTTGLLVIAKTTEAFKSLSAQLKARKITRIYQTIVSGILISGGSVDEPIGRHPIQRKRMAVVETGRPAITHYRIVERFRAHTRLKVQLETGRTHQIRVHMAHIKHPLLGDPIYAGRLQLPKGASEELIQELRTFKRQALHASELTLTHPQTQKIISWQSPLPEDIKKLLDILKRDAEHD